MRALNKYKWCFQACSFLHQRRVAWIGSNVRASNEDSLLMVLPSLLVSVLQGQPGSVQMCAHRPDIHAPSKLARWYLQQGGFVGLPLRASNDHVVFHPWKSDCQTWGFREHRRLTRPPCPRVSAKCTGRQDN